MPTTQTLLECAEEIIFAQVCENDELDKAVWPTNETTETLCADRQASMAEGVEIEIQQARLLAELKDDWDGEGSLGYSRAAIERAAGFVRRHALGLWESYGIECPVPTIGPGPHGSIDIHWKEPRWELLVNIPADPYEMAAFYGDNYGVQRIRGSFDPNKFNLGIAEWLKN